MKKGLDLREHARERKLWREAHPEEARLRDEKMALFYECEFYYMARFCDWPTKAAAARMVGVERATIGRAVGSGKLLTNDQDGRACRVDPMSLWEYRACREQRDRAGDDAWSADRGRNLLRA